MRNKKVSLKTCLILCIICVLSTATVFGSSTMRQIVAYLNFGLNIVVDGEVKELYDANGNRVYPISYSGSTYVPIRGIGEIFNAEVEWDSKTGSVIVNTKNKIEDIDLLKGLTKKTNYSYVLPENERNLTINNQVLEFENGLLCKNLQVSDFQLNDYVGIPITKGIKTVSFKAFSDNSASINIFNQQGKLIKTLYIQPNVLTDCIVNVDKETNTELYFVSVAQSDVVDENSSLKLFNMIGN